MRLLLDTHVFLWWVADDPSLPRPARRLIADPAHECLLSIASVWELAIKAGLGKLRLGMPIARFVTDQLAVNRFKLLGLTVEHVGLVETLPRHHGDPFDRLLIAQALVEDLAVLTADPVFARYGVARAR